MANYVYKSGNDKISALKSVVSLSAGLGNLNHSVNSGEFH